MKKDRDAPPIPYVYFTIAIIAGLDFTYNPLYTDFFPLHFLQKTFSFYRNGYSRAGSEKSGWTICRDSVILTVDQIRQLCESTF